MADEAAPEPTDAAPEAPEEAAAAPVEASKPGEDQFYAPPPDHVTGEVDDLAKLTNLNQDTLLSEIKVGCKPLGSSEPSVYETLVHSRSGLGLHRPAMTLAPSTRSCRTS